MIKALLLDLGGTLERDGHVLPGVADALEVMLKFQTGDGDRLVICLVSDFKMPMPRTPEAIDAIFKEYLAILDQLNLRRFFEPVTERVTLSTHAGAVKPARLIFETALQRARLNASLEDALFITEEAEHVKACRKMKMTALQFGVDFDEWTNAPSVVAGLVDSPSKDNLQIALKFSLFAKHDLRVQFVHELSGNTVRGKGQSWVKLDAPELGKLKGVHVELPTDVEARIDSKGQISDVRVLPPSREDLMEAVGNVQTLAANHQISADGSEDRRVLPTHVVETDKHGQRFLRRRRFTAL
jgi:hypothetical protein